MNSFKMQSGMKIGSPILRVKNIDKVLEFYERDLGLQVNQRYQNENDSSVYEIGFKNAHSDTPLLMLQYDPNAKSPSRRSAGLYHFAILVRDRKSLASTYLALRNSEVNYEEFADHLVTESLYMRDPEKNGIEIYRDLFGFKAFWFGPIIDTKLVYTFARACFTPSFNKLACMSDPA